MKRWEPNDYDYSQNYHGKAADRMLEESDGPYVLTADMKAVLAEIRWQVARAARDPRGVTHESLGDSLLEIARILDREGA